MSKNKLRIRSGDTVVVIAGKDRGKTGKVLRVDPEARKVAVEGVRVVTRHSPGQGDQPGGIVHKEALIDVSNVALWDTEAGRRVKVGYQIVDEKKVRVDRKTGTVLDKK